jgi:hypothetical protein
MIWLGVTIGIMLLVSVATSVFHDPSDLGSMSKDWLLEQQATLTTSERRQAVSQLMSAASESSAPNSPHVSHWSSRAIRYLRDRTAGVWAEQAA